MTTKVYARSIDQENFTFVFNTVADMVAYTQHEVGALIKTKGYYTAGDGGGASYLVQPGNTGDGFGDHDISANTAILQYKNRTIYGATYGLGTADDSARLQAARFNVLSTHGAGTVDISSYGNITLVTPEATGYMFRISPRFTLQGNTVGSWATTTRINLEPTSVISIGMNVSDAPDLTVEPSRQDGGSLKGVWIGANENVDVGCYWGTAGTSENTDVTISGAIKHGMIVVRSWYTKFRNIKVRDCLGAGITLGKHPDVTFTTSDSHALNACDFYNLDVSSCGLDDAYRLDSNEDTGYGVGFYGTMGGSTVRNITSEGNYGPGVLDALDAGSYLLDGVYLERNNQTGTDSNAYQILTIDNAAGGQPAQRTWKDVWLTFASGVSGKTLVRDSIHQYVFELNGSGERPEFLGDNARLSGNSRRTYTNFDPSGKIFRTIHSESKNINALGGGLQTFVSANNSSYFVYFIPEVTTTSTDTFQCRPRINGVNGSTATTTGPFTAYEPVLVHNFGMDPNQICQILFPDSYAESCQGYFVVQEGRIADEIR